jgi:hypothetical protein
MPKLFGAFPPEVRSPKKHHANMQPPQPNLSLTLTSHTPIVCCRCVRPCA